MNNILVFIVLDWIILIAFLFIRFSWICVNTTQSIVFSSHRFFVQYIL